MRIGYRGSLGNHLPLDFRKDTDLSASVFREAVTFQFYRRGKQYWINYILGAHYKGKLLLT